MNGACEGLRVLEVSRGMAGSLAGMVLADNGAEVIRIDKPGTETIGPVWGQRLRDRGKKSVYLDLERPKDNKTFMDLARTADIAIVAMRRQTVERLGIDHQAMAVANPRLIYATITSLGWDWPNPREHGYDAILEARAGWLAEQNGFREGPIHIAPPLAAFSAGLFTVHGIMAALLALPRVGLGQHVDVSLLSGMLIYRGNNILKMPQREGSISTRLFKDDPLGSIPLFNLNQCADGRWVALAGQNRMFAERALEAFESTDLLKDPRFRGIPRVFDKDEDREAFIRIIRERLARFTTDEVVRRLYKYDVPGEPVLTTEEFARHPQMEANKLAITVEDPVLGSTYQPGAVVKFSETPSPVGRPAPLPGQDTELVLSDLRSRVRVGPGAVAPGINGAPLKGGPLQGLRVLDLCSFFAGPMAGRLMADMGAEVIKVEPQKGDEYRVMRDTFAFANRGKRSIGVDLKSAEGREALMRLVETADILFHNLRPGVPERLGITYEDVSRRNPRIVYGWFTSFGRFGAMRSRPSYDSALSGLCGIDLDQGGEGNPPSYISAPDMTGALTLTAGMLMALRARDSIGKGQLVEGSLMGGMAMFTGQAFIQYPGKPPRKQVDKGQHGLGPLYRLYQTQDGWVFLACVREKHWTALRRAIGDARLDGPQFATREQRERHEKDLADILGQAFRSRGAAEWDSVLSAVDVPCAAVAPSHEVLFDTDYARQHHWSVLVEHSRYGTIQQPGPHLRLNRTPIALEKAEPALGEDTEALLTGTGYTSEQVKDLRQRNIIA